jgi:hydroxymethylbilane synthase
LLRQLRPDLKIEALRGNLDTRLRKLDEGQYAGIVLAAAGLKRLDLAHRIRTVFSTDDMLPAAGQGALGIEIGHPAPAGLIEALRPLADASTWLAVTAERAVSRAMGGSCSMPLAAHAVWQGDILHLRAAWGDPTTPTPHLIQVQGEVRLPGATQNPHLLDPTAAQQASFLGEQLAARLCQQGAKTVSNPS